MSAVYCINYTKFVLKKKICKSIGLQTHLLRSIWDVANNRVGHHQVRIVTASLLTQCTAKRYNKVA